MSTDYSDINGTNDGAQLNLSMNLGGAHHNGAYNSSSSKHVSELDIAKIVAQKYAKQA